MIKNNNTYSSLVESANQLIQDNYTIFKHIVFMPEAYHFDTQAAVQVLATWKADIFANTIHRSPEIWSIDDKGDEPVYHTFKDKSEIKTLENTFKYRIGFAAISDYWAKLRTFDGTDMRVAFIDYNNYIWLVNESGERKGFKQSLVSVHLNINGLSYIDITLDRLNTWTGIEVIDLGFDISDIIITKPTLSIVTVSGETLSTLTLAASITNTGGGTITDKGFIYSTNREVVEANRGIILSNTDVGSSFNDILNGLPENTSYYVKAWATNAVGTGLGRMIEATTESKDPVNMLEITLLDITPAEHTFSVSATITKGIAVVITEYGFVYASDPTIPTVSNSKLISTDGIALFEETSPTLADGYWNVRPYVISNVGIKYGAITNAYLGLPDIQYSIYGTRIPNENSLFVIGFNDNLTDIENLTIIANDGINGEMPYTALTPVNLIGDWTRYYGYIITFANPITSGSIVMTGDGFNDNTINYSAVNKGAINISRPYVQKNIVLYFNIGDISDSIIVYNDRRAVVVILKELNGVFSYENHGIGTITGNESTKFPTVYNIGIGSVSVTNLKEGTLHLNYSYNNGTNDETIVDSIEYRNIVYLIAEQYTLTEGTGITTITCKFKIWGTPYYHTDILTNNTTIKIYDQIGNELTINSSSYANNTYTFEVATEVDRVVLNMVGHYNLNQLIN